jgi:glutaconate CoA-transferase, subunit B
MTPDYDPRELIIAVIARLAKGARNAAVGAQSPIPGSGLFLAQAWARAAGQPPMQVIVLGSRHHYPFTDGGRELFNMAGQGRLDLFFLSGGQIDGEGNCNLVGIGGYPQSDVRFAGSFGSAYLYFTVPRVILFREEHSRRVMVPKVDFVSAPGTSPANHYRHGGPVALVTPLCLFSFDKRRRRFALASIHEGHSLEAVLDQTGFEFDRPAQVPFTPPPTAADLALMRGEIAAKIADPYPQFAAKLWGYAAPAPGGAVPAS